jgi:hypothetical protein
LTKPKHPDMAKPKAYQITWFDEPEEHNYPAAESYLTLLFEEKAVREYAKRLRKAKLTRFKAKDIFRASGLSLLGVSNHHVERDRRKILGGKKLSPLLLVRDTVRSRLIIADGYHLLCSVYQFDEDAWIPCKIV